MDLCTGVKMACDLLYRVHMSNTKNKKQLNTTTSRSMGCYAARLTVAAGQDADSALASAIAVLPELDRKLFLDGFEAQAKLDREHALKFSGIVSSHHTEEMDGHLWFVSEAV